LPKKRVLYILLFLGLIVIGGGAWMLATSPPEIYIPESEPVIYEQVTYHMRGENYELYIYDDGSTIYIREEGLRVPTAKHPAVRTWSTGKFTPQQLDSLVAYMENSGLDKLDEYYQFPGEPNESGGFRMSDMHYTITVNSENLSKTVTASGYLTPDKGETYPDMPSPLNEIYMRLHFISQATEEVYREDIKD
jgi:hypothetical protein